MSMRWLPARQRDRDGARQVEEGVPSQRPAAAAMMHSTARAQGGGEAEEKSETLVQWSCPNMLRHNEAGARFYRMETGKSEVPQRYFRSM